MKKSKQNKLSNRITVRLTDDEYRQIDTAAKRLKISQAAVVRSLIFYVESDNDLLDKIDKKQPHNEVIIRGVDRTTVLKLIGELNRIGTNINQIAHKVNRDNHVPHETKKELKQTNKLLEKVLGVLGCHM